MLGVVCMILGIFPNRSVADDQTVKIAVMSAMTGKAGNVGPKQMAGAKLAVEEINAKGGLKIGDKRVKIEAVYEDSQSDPKVAVAKMKAMIEGNKVTALVGGTFADETLALNDLSRQMPFLFCATAGGPEQMFTPQQKGPYTVCMIPPLEAVGSGAAAYVVQHMGAKNIVSCMADYSYGHATLRGMERVFVASPGVKHTNIFVPVGTKDMKPLLAKALEGKPDAIMMGLWGEDAVTILKQAREMNIQHDVPVFFNWLVDAFAVNVPPDAMGGVKCQMFWYHTMARMKHKELSQTISDFMERYQAAQGDTPDPYAVAAYMGVCEVARAMELAGSSDPDRVYKALMAHPDWNGPKGPATWMVDGYPRYKYFSFILRGLGEDERKTTKSAFARVITVFSGEGFLKSPKELDW